MDLGLSLISLAWLINFLLKEASISEPPLPFRSSNLHKLKYHLNAPVLVKLG
jgi:hypothetical protein